MRKILRAAALMTTVSTLSLFSSAQAAGVLPYSSVFEAIRDCSPGSACGTTVLPGGLGVDSGAKNVSLSTILPGRGAAFGAAGPSDDALAFPVLHASSSVSSTATTTSLVYGLQGYINDTAAPLEVGFGGILDYTRSLSGFGFVTAGLMLVDTSLRNPLLAPAIIGNAPDGSFTATCATTGVLSVVNSGRQDAMGGGSAAVDTASGACAGTSTAEGLVLIDPGQEFFVIAELLTFQVLDGFFDASSTFSVGLSASLSDEQAAAMEEGLAAGRELAPVPEPSTWALMTLAFGAMGLALRRRAAALAA